MEIRSFRRVFDLERRVYSVDRLRLNPSGVPVRGVVYFVALVVAVLAGTRLPLLGDGIALAPWYLRDLLGPALAATLMALIRVEGRTFHHAARAVVLFACSRRRLTGGVRGCRLGRWYPNDVLVIPDGSESRFRPLVYTGPGAVLVQGAHERHRGPRGRGLPGWRARSPRPTLFLRRGGGEGGSPGAQVILLAAGARLQVQGERQRGA
jgi:hypothetical protein